jgi:hypothetical protein
LSITTVERSAIQLVRTYYCYCLWNFETLQQKLEIKLSPRGTKTGKEGGGLGREGVEGGMTDGSKEMMDKGGERADLRRNDWWEQENN